MKKYDDSLGCKGVPVGIFSANLGLSLGYVQKLCREGKIFGARQHPLSKHWWIYPPARLLCEPRKLRASASTVRISSLPASVLV